MFMAAGRILVMDRSVNMDSTLSPLQTRTALRTLFGLRHDERFERPHSANIRTDLDKRRNGSRVRIGEHRPTIAIEML